MKYEKLIEYRFSSEFVVGTEVYIPHMVQIFIPRSSPVQSTLGNSDIDFFNPDSPNKYFWHERSALQSVVTFSHRRSALIKKPILRKLLGAAILL